ncbi:MAG: prepilin-type N-terminal cleavage/methylation domain-containing protein [Planctomycetaceae bacterium]|jgi:prepilin-type N-terminal cleavage/methylation domain-containing protein|nr:prepilin-type N-terminal cleavage/methylation domain-containing protein [Planctomycetaceae bacterium]
MKTINPAFTLIELMVVTVIIALLAALAATAYFGAMQSAREVKTIGTIAKLDSAITEIYEGYEFQYEHIEDLLDSGSRNTFNTAISTMDDAAITRIKRLLMCDLMRMEMPSNREEVNESPRPIPGGYSLELPVVQRVYHEILSRNSARDSTIPIPETQSAELLFLIITNLYPEALENFTASEIGDTDGNGLSEFIDGWGRPIAFLRFAPGFAGSDRQPDLSRISGINVSTSLNIIADLQNITVPSSDPPITVLDKIINQWQDPFDPEMINRESWFLYPVIVSAGRDGNFGFEIKRNGEDSVLYDPFSEGALVGAPNDTSYRHDNIHNHAN